MKIIPVIDIKDGIVVSARKGQRDCYQAINSKICCSSTINDVISGFLSIFAFDTLYIADLNAIMGTGNNDSLIKQTILNYQSIDIWVDKGEMLQNLPKQTHLNHRIVIGSESQNITKAVKLSEDLLLSLDFDSQQNFLGPKVILKKTSFWPTDIILMTLGRVGSNVGPDLEKLSHFYQTYPDKNFIAAGGIRNKEDLLNLKKIGVTQTLVASALHSGAITTEHIKNMDKEPL